jgi:phosphoribosylamine--glycine ligase
MRLQDEGHEVRVLITEPGAQGTMAGLVDRAPNLKSGLAWIRQAANDGIILFESVSEGFGAQQDALRRQGFHVVGGSAYGDRLENDRAYAQDVLASLGFPQEHVWEFSDAASALEFLTFRPGRYVLKFCGPDHASQDNYIGQMSDGSDIRAMLAARTGDAETFILMEFIDGIEMGIGAYFNGEDFLLPACLDWEHKRFFAGGMGELTGEMGTVATFDRSGAFFAETLAKLAPLLRNKEHIGYVNLNTIVNDRGIWPLEFTCRFGYPGFAVLDPIQKTAWGDLFARMVTGIDCTIDTRAGFSVGVVLTTPPFPYSRKQVVEPIGLPIQLNDVGAEDWRNLHYGEVGLQNDVLVTSGLYGWTMVVTGVAVTISEARSAAYHRLAKITVPNGRYRLDIGARLEACDFAQLEQLSVFG